MNVEQTIAQEKEFLGLVGKRRLWIQTHDIPDPDALAAAEAFRIIARHHGVKARIVVNGLPHRRENKALIKECQIHIRTMDSLKIRNPELSAWVFVDCLPDSGNVTLHPLAPGNLFMAIDHHGNPNMALHPDAHSYFIVDAEEGATATIVGGLLLAMKIPFPPRLAVALSYAIITDTQDFSRGASESDLRVYNALFPVTSQKILSRLRNASKPRQYFRIVHTSLTNTYFYRHLAWVYIGGIESGESVAEMADFILTCERITWSLAIGHTKSRLILSLRSSSPRAQCGNVIHRLIPRSEGTAGGHNQFAGGFIPLNADSKPAVLADKIIKRFIAALARIPKSQDIPTGTQLIGE